MTKHRLDAMLRRGARDLLVIAVLTLGAAHAQNAHHDHAFHRDAEIGGVDFRADCALGVRDRLDWALGLVHYSMYEQARTVFAEVAEEDPSCAIAHWGTELVAAQAEVAMAGDLAVLYAAVAGFADVEEATTAGYGPASACMAGDLGAQGIHYGKDALFVPSVVLETPQLLMYEPRADGSLRFLGVEYLVFQQAWHDAGHVERPTLLGQTFGLNETLLDEPFYLLHVWVGQFNPSGLFANWNPLVDCGNTVAGAH